MCQSELVLMNVANGGFCIIVWLVVVWICCMWLVSPICVLDCDCVMYVLLCVNGVLFVVGVCCWWKTTLAMCAGGINGGVMFVVDMGRSCQLGVGVKAWCVLMCLCLCVVICVV